MGNICWPGAIGQRADTRVAPAGLELLLFPQSIAIVFSAVIALWKAFSEQLV